MNVSKRKLTSFNYFLRGRDRSVVNKLRLKVILLITFLSFNLLTGADSPFSGKRIEAIPHLSSFQASKDNLILSPKAAQRLPSATGRVVEATQRAAKGV
ncbi:hypothetical protein EHQ67_08965 [Leptospira kmetyi]|nr:hypothetical protein EHQ67_08965 [Leptospira kmetyi]